MPDPPPAAPKIKKKEGKETKTSVKRKVCRTNSRANRSTEIASSTLSDSEFDIFVESVVLCQVQVLGGGLPKLQRPLQPKKTEKHKCKGS